VAVATLCTLRLEVTPSPDTNDHQVRILVDGEDLIAARWPDMIGLDPDALLVAPSPLRPGGGHDATIARCSCGIAGCGSQEARILVDGERVLWRLAESDELAFDGSAYRREIERAERDTGWEPADRTAARLVREGVDRRALAAHGLAYGWASARLDRDRFTVSLTLEPGPFQILVSVPWTGVDPEPVAAEVVALLARPPQSWPDVTYSPIGGGDALPSLCGPGWRRR
jgi:hypothetical protein